MKFDWLLVVFLVLVFAERLYEQRFSRTATRGERKIVWVMWSLHTLYLGILAGAGVEHFLWRWPVCWPVTAVGLVGVALAMVVRLAAIRALGRFWSLHLEIRADHALVTDGIYSRLRHPAYAAIMLEVVALPCVANAYGMLGVGLLVYIPILLVRWRNEERAMVEKFGDRYLQYQRTVPAFFPRWKK